jgi:preprotein translocase subunit SecA
MTIQLKPDQEQVIAEAIQAGIIQTPRDVVDAGVEAIRRRLEVRVESESSISAEQWLQEFHNWVNSHSTSTPLLSDEAISRESIYGTRGL